MTASLSLSAAYSSDLTDDQWRQLAPWLPEEKFHGRRRVTDLRQVVNAINYREQTGCSWRRLPADFPNWGTVYRYYREFRRDGTLSRLRSLFVREISAPSAASLHLPAPQSTQKSA